MSNTRSSLRHLTVSRGILKRFADRKSKELEQFDFHAGTSQSQKYKRVGVSEEGVAWEAQAYEDKWQESERHLGLVYDAFKRGVLHTDTTAIEAAKSLIALHAARSITMKNVVAVTRESSKYRVMNELLAGQPEKLAAMFRERTGRKPLGANDIVAEATWRAEQAAASSEAGEYLGRRIECNLDALDQLLTVTSIQVLIADASARRFMIGDDPSPSMKVNCTGLGPSGGVPWSDATTIGLPMSPDFMIALKERPGMVEISDFEVEFLNRVQMSYAERSVFYRADPVLRCSAESLQPIKDTVAGNFQKRLLSVPTS